MENPTPRKSKTTRDKNAGPPMFDVTVQQVIGTVHHSSGGDHPHVVAFRLIAEHGTEGTFQFPHDSGGVCNVVVSITDPPSDPARERGEW